MDDSVIADTHAAMHVDRYIETFESGFDEGLKDVSVSFMQSDGGLTPVNAFSGHKVC